MMCAGFADVKNTLGIFEKCGIEYLHTDIMDGSFVPNFTLGTDYCRELKKMTDIPLDIHLMIDRPEEKLGWFPVGEGDIVSVHTESTPHIQKALAYIKSKGALAFAAVNPGTPVYVLEEIADVTDGILVMTVNPGFAGQKMVPQTLDKIRRIREIYPGKLIETDGNVSFENAVKMKAAGADIFVGGTSSIFSPEDTVENNIEKMRRILR